MVRLCQPLEQADRDGRRPTPDCRRSRRRYEFTRQKYLKTSDSDANVLEPPAEKTQVQILPPSMAKIFEDELRGIMSTVSRVPDTRCPYASRHNHTESQIRPAAVRNAMPPRLTLIPGTWLVRGLGSENALLQGSPLHHSDPRETVLSQSTSLPLPI